MRFDILTIFPSFFDSPLRCGILKRAIERSLIRIRIHDIRDYALDRHRTTDDYPYGGGEGMVMKVEPIYRAVEKAKEESEGEGIRSWVVLLTPQGKTLKQEKVLDLSRKEGLTLICGRYEGVDERLRELVVDEEISIGDYVLSGGEAAALVIVDAVSRLIKGVVGCERSPEMESFSTGLLEHPHYTRPRVFMGRKVPDVLLSGNHREIERWRRYQSLKRTYERRPDLLEKASLTEEDKKMLEEIKSVMEDRDGHLGKGREGFDED